MKKSTLFRLILAAMLVLMLSLVACSKGDDTASKETDGKKSEQTDDGKDKDEKEEGLYSIDDFEKTVEGEAMDGGELVFGLVTSSPFKGTLNYNFYSDAYDKDILQWFDESLLSMDETFNYTQDGAATFEVSDDKKTFTFTIRDEVKWHDGEPVKAEDWAFAHEVIAHPDYDGVRFDATLRNIEGIEEYHDGEADSISGIEVLNDKQLKITYKEATPSLLSGGIWTYALPKHIFKDIPVKDMSSSDAVRKNPIGMGPFKVDNIVPGESVTLSKFEDYWRGEPKLDKVTIKVIGPQVVVNELENGTVDMVSSFPTDQYPDNADMDNVEFLGNVEMAYTYMGFKLGTWDKKNKRVKPDPNAKMADVNLRRAMWYAVDNDAVGKKFYHGLRWNATTLIPPSHPTYHDETIEAPTYDPDKANEILDEAGYTERDEDGFRMTPDGEKLVINFASMEGGDTAEPLAEYYMQAWKEVGLNVQLLDGRLQEFNAFYERVGEKGDDDPEVDVYQGAWGVGSDVDPSGLYGPEAIFNFPRYQSDKNDELLAKGLSEEAFDEKYRQEAYKEWQEFMVEEIPVFPTLYRAELVPVNKRVVNYSIDRASDIELYQLGVTQEEPFKASK
ncbi:peptide/nickel transport system substrate-binding protein [Cerasibacillus quisquiliarum]|uniref:oligopeptide ABC transporter substrate-binding protein n=2 Tax=Cerasibacillus quisquiliarum TaxID=227865 RepID=UPI00160C97C4|nr:oligopeptide ABC transporter substrate-binding protein [Cerasibacillus quisquiliarum]MBB5147404.1 peptide/nickel transport system substrate-binding protein [Cerasibacillus quisquiliarum]